MPNDNFQRIKQAVADAIETIGLPSYVDRYLDLEDLRFATVYFGEWTEEQIDLEEAEVSGAVHIQLYALNDTELALWQGKVRAVLKEFDLSWTADDGDLLELRWQSSGGEVLPEESGVRPSSVLNYSVAFIDK